MPQRLGHSKKIRQTTVLKRNKPPKKTSVKLQTKSTSDAVGKRFQLRREGVTTAGIQGVSPTAEVAHLPQASPILAGVRTRSGLPRAACRQQASCCSGIKEELNIHSLMAVFCPTKNPAELRQILSTLQKESGCAEKGMCKTDGRVEVKVQTRSN